MIPPLDLDRLEAQFKKTEHVCYVCCDVLPQLLRIAQAAQANQAAWDLLDPKAPPFSHHWQRWHDFFSAQEALRAALESREP